MRRHLLVVLEKKIQMLKNCFWGHKKSSITGGATITFCAQTAHITNICMKSGLITFNTLAVTLRTDDAGRMTLSPTTLYYKLTDELKMILTSSTQI